MYFLVKQIGCNQDCRYIPDVHFCIFLSDLLSFVIQFKLVSIHAHLCVTLVFKALTAFVPYVPESYTLHYESL